VVAPFPLALSFAQEQPDFQSRRKVVEASIFLGEWQWLPDGDMLGKQSFWRAFIGVQ